jgi:HEAT repeat protein
LWIIFTHFDAAMGAWFTGPRMVPAGVELFQTQGLTVVVKWLAFGAISVDLGLVIFILSRRAAHNRFYLRKDAAQKRFSKVIADYFAGNLSPERTTPLLNVGGRPEREAARALLLGSIKAKTQRQATDLLLALGFVQQWAEQAFGKRRAKELLRSIVLGEGPRTSAQKFRRNRLRHLRRLRLFSISRAVAAGRLGRLSPEFSSCFMQEALRDPSPYVGRLAVASIGRNQIPDGVPILLEELRRSVEGETELPIRSIQTALVRYPMADLRHFTSFLNRGSPRFRFLAVNSIREMCAKAGSFQACDVEFPADLRQWFLERAVRDESPDVRARSAGVIAHFRVREATEALRFLLGDENEFVRLHSVRACADPYYSDLIGDTLRRITDERWRVREAAVQTVAGFQPGGRQQLEQFFLDTTDRYASEQIGEDLQRSGMALQIVSALASPDGEGIRARKVCCKMAELGMVSLMAEELASGQSLDLRTQLLEILSASETPQFIDALRRIVAHDADPLKIKAGVLLRAHESKAIAELT